MIEELKQFSKIIVSGPQRSGTNFLTAVLSEELGYRFIDEEEYNFHYEKKFIDILRSNEKIVMQAPAMSHILHKIKEASTCILFCLRNPSDIIKSQHNLRWDAECHERVKYTRPEYEYLPISIAKYLEWFFHQRQNLEIPYIEVYYDCLKKHPLWVDKKDRSYDRWAIVHPDNKHFCGNSPEGELWRHKVAKLEFENQDNINKQKIY